MSKIAILTQPLGGNYGGMLQAYALQTYLKNLGYDSKILPREYSYKRLWIRPSMIKYFFTRNLRRRISVLREMPIANRKFLRQNLVRTSKTFSNSKIARVSRKFDTFIVGSDQVWRKAYSPKIENFFLDFAADRDNVKRISYAASFGGKPDYDFGKFKELIAKFDGISVREKSAVAYAHELWGIEAQHVLDPSLLLDADQYRRLYERDDNSTNNQLSCYILDHSTTKDELISQVTAHTGLTARQLMSTDGKRKNVNVLSLPEWVREFDRAKFVITDSFHGVAMSIIFRKPFIAIGNPSRGMDRFESVLNLFGLSERLIMSDNGIPKELIDKPIDWGYVENVLKNERQKAFNFLQTHLSS